ncbi:Mitochondrial coenzyme A transporter SLC25A42 [Aphelenchoides fujianensis]|nr:Mitochondrial coenzyme A transporter SLC25A42 [Aphelenchoides fujianensis]
MSPDDGASSSTAKPSPSTTNPERWRHVFPNLASGAIAGAVAKTTIAPLDRTKINFQVSRTRRYSIRAALKFVKLTYINTGFASLFRGNSATMARARLSVSSKEEYPSLRAVFVSEYRQHGLSTFYRGITPTLIGVVPYAGSSFFTYETLKLLYHEETNKQPNALVKLAFGAFAGLVGQSSSYPLDIVRRRMQTGRVPPGQGVFRTLYEIALNEGVIRGLYKGLSMNWIKGPVAVGISFTTYDHVVVHLRRFAQAV